MPRRSPIEGAMSKNEKVRIFAFRLIEKFSRLKFDEFLSNKMTDNEPNNLHINKQKKERKKNIATAQCACSRTQSVCW